MTMTDNEQLIRELYACAEGDRSERAASTAQGAPADFLAARQGRYHLDARRAQVSDRAIRRQASLGRRGLMPVYQGHLA